MTDPEPMAQRPTGRPRAFDGDAVLAAATDLFWREGYAAASLPALSEATGLSTSSLYNAFGSKLDLFVAALDCYLDGPMAFMLGPMLDGSQGLADVDAFLDRLAATTRVDPPRGCLIVNTIGEFRDPPPDVAARTKRYRRLLRGSLRAALGRAAAVDEIPKEEVDARTDAIVPIVVAFHLLVASRAPARETRELVRAARAIALG
jgi:TetR/AcrR family transcriptional repressor of nem operon